MSLTIAPGLRTLTAAFELLEEPEQHIAAHGPGARTHALHRPVCAYHFLPQIKQKSKGTPVKHLCSITAYHICVKKSRGSSCNTAAA